MPNILLETANDDALNEAVDALDTQATELRRGTAQLKKLAEAFDDKTNRPVQSQLSMLDSLAAEIADARENVLRVRDHLASLRK
jgi:uncharacterized coiled-coil protein SlyX